MKNEVVLVTSHANNHKKKEILKDCVLEIKRQGYDIILSSHIEVDNDVKELVDYFILDKENPIVKHTDYHLYDKSPMSFWIKQRDFYFSVVFELNHGYAVLKLIKNGASIALINGYDKIHIVDYDYILKDDNVIKTHSNLLESYDLVKYNWEDRLDLVSSGLFSVRTDCFVEKTKNIKSKEDYFNYCHTAIFEEFLYVLFKDVRLNNISDISLLRQKNEVDKVHVSISKPKKDSGENIILFLTREEKRPGELFLLIMAFDEQNPLVEFTIGQTTHKVNLPKYENFLVEINKTDLENGIEVNIPDYEYSNVLNNSTVVGDCVSYNNIFYKYNDFINELQRVNI